MFFVSIAFGFKCIEKCWHKVGPWIFFLMTIYNFILAPIATITMVLIYFFDKTDNEWFVWFRSCFIFYALVQLGNMI